MRRRHIVAAGVAQGAVLGVSTVFGQAPGTSGWAVPDRFQRPADLASDESGLWALMDREEGRLRRGPFIIRDAALNEYLHEVVCKLVASHCVDLRIYVVETPFFNASMAPNGMVQVWSGLLLRVENEAQLAAVLGHEIGHYLRRHTLDQLRDAKSRSAFSTFLAAFGVVGLVGQLATLASAFGFTRDQEREADQIGLTLMRDAGYDPREASKIWDNLLAEAAAAPAGDPLKSSPMFATHPPSHERSSALALLAQGSSGGVVGDKEYAAKIAGIEPRLLDDELKRGQYGESLVLFNRMLQRWPERADLYYYRGEVQRLRGREGDLEASLADLRRAVVIGNEPAQTHRSLGYVFQKYAQPREASAEFARYIELAPEAPDAGIIRTYIAEGRT